MFSDVSLNNGICDVLYNQCISIHVRTLDFYLILGRITRVRISVLWGKKSKYLSANTCIWYAKINVHPLAYISAALYSSLWDLEGKLA